ncbi:MAG: hypothetical protein LBN27_01130 [Prevotellaceae bacterium]|jgi:hypothetical protein|nr:hypothetical protein [Prevotellaceae bacterium]
MIKTNLHIFTGLFTAVGTVGAYCIRPRYACVSVYNNVEGVCNTPLHPRSQECPANGTNICRAGKRANENTAFVWRLNFF